MAQFTRYDDLTAARVGAIRTGLAAMHALGDSGDLARHYSPPCEATCS